MEQGVRQLAGDREATSAWCHGEIHEDRMRALAGRDDSPVLELLVGDHPALTPMRNARILF